VPPGPLRVAVLLLGFNRPNTTRTVFNQIRRAKPPRLYMAVDGPRPTRPDDVERCRAVQEISKEVDWPCEVYTLFRDQNLGCKTAVEQAVSWFFSTEEKGIVLEDDCLPEQSFFWFCQELLDTYAADARIGVIGGGNYQKGMTRSEASYYFTRYSCSWGWASWRRYWQLYDGRLESFNLTRLLQRLRKMGGPIFAKYWGEIFLRCKSAEGLDWANISPWSMTIDQKKKGKTEEKWFDTWDYPLILSGFMQDREVLHIVPEVNLVKNIGFGADSTHTSSGYNPTANSQDIRFPIRHPTQVSRCDEADRFVDRTFFQINAMNVLRLVAARRYSRLRGVWKRMQRLTRKESLSG
jgi:hypothetical protein